MSEDVKNGIFVFILIGVFIGFGGVLSWAITKGVIEGEYQPKAIERNAAYWQVDQKTGATEFKWKDVPPTEPK